MSPILYPLLQGSSEGKAVLFFFFMGSLLVLNSIITDKISIFASIDNSRRYLKYTLLIALFTYLVGILLEIWLRIYFDVSLFTIFISLNPEVTSTSIMHSHVFKSAIGSIPTTLGITLSSNIHTGESLFKYVSPLTYLIILTLPVAYITSLISMDKRIDIYRVIIAFAASLTLIGMIDGGLFSNPAIIGLAGLLGMYFIEKPFSPRNLIKPTLIVLIIILAGLTVEIAGSNPDYHQITLINQTESIDWSGYHITNVINTNNHTNIQIETTQNEKENLLKLFKTLKGKADGFFITWNFYSYL